ncbi:MAG: CHAD domain-containing protein [Candidatus Sedimenticola sp. 20ELBAFRAG]
METAPFRFELPEEWDTDQTIRALSDRFFLDQESERQVSRVYYDSFDWRLYLGGGVLRQEQVAGDRMLIWSDLDEASPRETIRLTGEMPRFYQELPQGLTRDQLEPLLEMRALLPKLELKTALLTLRVLDDEAKTVVRIVLESNSCRAPRSGAFKPMGSRIRLLPVRGYGRELAKVQKYLGGKLKLKSGGGCLLESGIASIGGQIADYSSKLDFKLDPKQRADKVAKQIHLHLLNTLETNIPGTKADLDSEFLHDLRVATRRTRSALTQIKGVFSDEDIERFKSRLAWIGSITGPTRDMDVYLLGYEEYRDSLPEQFRKDMQPLHDFLVAHQKSEHQAMVRKINSPHFRVLVKEWREFLEAPVPKKPTATNAAKPVINVAGRRIYRVFERLLADGRAIQPDSPPEMLHELRKDCKKLRYLLEFFQSLYPQKRVKPLIKSLKSLLDNLGEFQDLEVQADKLRTFAHQMIQEGDVPADTLLAMGMLVEDLLSMQQQARAVFAARFGAFSAAGNCGVFEDLFAPKKKNKKEKAG